ncbi:Bestrophin, RFP-TM, chloride channel-domain-containing protein [Mycena leptocephala]|nr:Bestrophin, RFP-TM, chloride channel-domain-containing protein [Mycena leptocephala]
MSMRKGHSKAARSLTGNHPLLPAMRPAPPPFIPKIPTYTFLKWTFGRGSVIWKIWPAVLLHTLFAAAIVYISKATKMVKIPNVMLTVMGVVIGFVISYRAMTGYDRYWMGRTAWTDVIRNARTMGRLIWYHIPLRLSPGANAKRSPQELAKVMAEKRMALDLVEAFAVALKHHLRGELGIYYEDLYDLVRPLHDFTDPDNPRPTVASAVPSPSTAPTPSAPPAAAQSTVTSTHISGTSSGVSPSTSSSSGATLKVNTHATKRPGALPVAASSNATGTGIETANPSASQTSLHRPLLPASNPAPEDGVLRRVSPDVIPFAGVAAGVGAWIRGVWQHWTGRKELDRHRHRGKDRSSRLRAWSGPIHPQGVAQLEEYEMGENLPEEVLRCLSEWLSVLEERGTVPGASLGSMLAGIQQFEMSLTTLEHILTTPLPFVYSVHIRCARSSCFCTILIPISLLIPLCVASHSHVVWLYLFLLPLQLVDDFGWHTVPALSVGAFVYLGFVAAGEEIEQPFGYDDNDLDLDMFCRDIIRQDIRCLKKAPCLNAWFPPSPLITDRDSSTVNGDRHANDSILSPESASTADAGPGATLGVAGWHEHGGNMYRASLASLSDTASLSISEEDEEDEAEVEMETETEFDGDGRVERVEHSIREGELVDVR